MKKNVLALSIAAMIGGMGFAGVASAGVIKGSAAINGTTKIGVSDAERFLVNEGGTGHNLVVPYFTVQNNNMTVIHIVNTDTTNGKAVKVRFRGAANSDDLMDFQVLLSPQDVFTAAVVQGADGGLQLVSSDNTCTLPRLNSAAGVVDGGKLAGKQGFFNGTLGRLNPKLTGDAKANGAREGYVEIFNMADIPSDKLYGTTAAEQSSLYKAIKHNAAGVASCDSTVLANLIDNDYWDEDKAALAGLAVPTTGLMADWYIMNLAQTTTFSGAATALTAVKTVGTANVATAGNFVLFPQKNKSAALTIPATLTAGLNALTADPLFRFGAAIAGTAKTNAGVVSGGGTTPVIKAGQYDLPDMSTPYLDFTALNDAAPEDQAEALTQALATLNVRNQYANDASVTGKTDWVFSMPTRRYSVAVDYKGSDTAVPAVRMFSPYIMGAGAGAKAFFHSDNTTLINSKGNAQVCVDADNNAFYGREEEAQVSGAVLSPGDVAQARFCGEVNVLSFADTGASVLGASVARQDTGTSAFTRGWADIETSNAGSGLPIIGYAFQKLTNPSAGANFSGTYGISWPHRYVRP